MTYEFDATLLRLPGKIAWTVFYVPDDFVASIGSKGRIPVKAVLDGAEFRGTLLPSSNGHYLVYNQSMRRHCRKAIGDTVHVLLTQDLEQREVEIPDDMQSEVEKQGVLAKFNGWPYYIRREEVNKITSAKTDATRKKRINALIDKIRVE